MPENNEPFYVQAVVCFRAHVDGSRVRFGCGSEALLGRRQITRPIVGSLRHGKASAFHCSLCVGRGILAGHCVLAEVGLVGRHCTVRKPIITVGAALQPANSTLAESWLAVSSHGPNQQCGDAHRRVLESPRTTRRVNQSPAAHTKLPIGP